MHDSTNQPHSPGVHGQWHWVLWQLSTNYLFILNKESTGYDGYMEREIYMYDYTCTNNYTHACTCYVVNCVESKSKPPNLKGILFFAAQLHCLNVFPIFFSEWGIIGGHEGRALKPWKVAAHVRTDETGMKCRLVSIIKVELDFSSTCIISILNQLLQIWILKWDCQFSMHYFKDYSTLHIMYFMIFNVTYNASRYLIHFNDN